MSQVEEVNAEMVKQWSCQFTQVGPGGVGSRPSLPGCERSECGTVVGH